ncbi:MAG: diadenylate cyclase CdaA [Clostridia bacterium]|nr:diadenylate cyclase CdaA [Clostridia bacterium]
MLTKFFADFFENIKMALFSFDGVVDFLDVVLVAFVIYVVINFIRGTRAFQLAKGVLFLAAIYFLVSLFEMRASEFILTFIFSNLFMILVVIFSPEIRHALETMGRGSASIFNIFSIKNKDNFKLQEDIKNSINSVCKACADMSDKQIGALIVFERETLLGEISKTGTAIDAVVTTELIGNIFFPKAPLHDGATIIKDGRVVSAGCFLPLSNNNRFSSDLGTRHRAAVGMSESSDAIIIVVSEETGGISVAEKGYLKRNISDGDLREILMKTFTDDDKQPSKIKRILRGNKDEK